MPRRTSCDEHLTCQYQCLLCTHHCLHKCVCFGSLCSLQFWGRFVHLVMLQLDFFNLLQCFHPSVNNLFCLKNIKFVRSSKQWNSYTRQRAWVYCLYHPTFQISISVMHCDVDSLCSHYSGAQMVWNEQTILTLHVSAIGKIYHVIW